ncbi:hypothetical protein KC318_g3430 [Hortaea werneckii]|nr:hypothetical protein KC334_g3896 [Hortaea werneckii]KAI7014472.1 hypothetical protein KC355_g4681 [Hortaea werneckii]KAI7671545.1 hypothetical protein KC318_g3430 [Hortaea werneckii]
MADWKVTVPINLPLDTIMAIHNGGGIEDALSELGNSTGEGRAVVQDVARAVIDTVNGSAYRITSNNKSTTPLATYSHSTSKTAKGYEAYDSLSMSKGSVCSERIPSQEGIIEKGGWFSPLYIHIVIRSTVNKDEHFYVTPDTTIASLFDSYVARSTVSGNFSWLKHEVWGKSNESLNESATIKQVGLKNDAVLVAVETPGKPVTVTFKDAMLRTHIIESEDNTMVKALLLSYTDDTGHDLETLIFVVNGEWELGQADYASTLRDCGIKSGDLITVRPREEEPQYINIIVQDPLGHQHGLTVRGDAQTSTLRSQYDALTGYKPGKLLFSFKGSSLTDGHQLHTVGIREGSCVQVRRDLPVPEQEFAAPSCPPTSPNLFAPSRVLSNSTTIEIVADGRSTKCTVEVPLAAFSSDGDSCSVTNARMSDFVAATTAEVAKAVRRQDSDLDLENPATCAIDVNVEEYNSWGTDTGNEDTIQKEGHLNFSQGSSAAPSPGDDVNEGWFRNARTEKFVEAQTALGLGTASSTLQPLQDGINEWDFRSSRDLDQATSNNNSYDRQDCCTNCDTGYCWDHPPHCVDSQEALGNVNCGKSSVLLHDNIAQPSPSDWGRDDRISQSGGDWANGLGFTPSSDSQAGSKVRPASDVEEATDAQIIKVYVTNGIFKERCYKIKSTCALTGLFEDVSSDFGTLLYGIMHLRKGFAIRHNDTAEENCLIDGDRLFAS